MQIDLLKSLSEVFGPSGFENEVVDLIEAWLTERKVNFQRDNMGNLIVKLGAQATGKRPLVLIDAHTDEVGLMIQYINAKGFLKFIALGGINPEILPANLIKIRTTKGTFVYGVICTIPPHLKSKKESEFSSESMWIDVGALSLDEVLKMGIRVGSPAVIDAKFRSLSETRVIGKALDDRCGCLMLLELIDDLSTGRWKPSDIDVCFSFSVQEEVGLRGVAAVVREVNPDLFFAVEGTVCCDIPDVPEEKMITQLGKGPAITAMDKSVIAPPKLVEYAIDLAAKHEIGYQFKTPAYGGTNSGVVHMMKRGIPCLTIATPCRYIHTQQSMLSIQDFNNGKKLLKLMIDNSCDYLN